MNFFLKQGSLPTRPKNINAELNFIFMPPKKLHVPNFRTCSLRRCDRLQVQTAKSRPDLPLFIAFLYVIYQWWNWCPKNLVFRFLEQGTTKTDSVSVFGRISAILAEYRFCRNCKTPFGYGFGIGRNKKLFRFRFLPKNG